MMPKSPDGLLVVSLEQAIAAPPCAAQLADAGARLIRIERAEGDFARSHDAVARGEGAHFVWLDRGKESPDDGLGGFRRTAEGGRDRFRPSRQRLKISAHPPLRRPTVETPMLGPVPTKGASTAAVSTEFAAISSPAAV